MGWLSGSKSKIKYESPYGKGFAQSLVKGTIPKQQKLSQSITDRVGSFANQLATGQTPEIYKQRAKETTDAQLSGLQNVYNQQLGDSTRNVLQGLGARGVVNSSAMGNAMGNVQQQLDRGIGNQMASIKANEPLLGQQMFQQQAGQAMGALGQQASMQSNVNAQTMNLANLANSSLMVKRRAAEIGLGDILKSSIFGIAGGLPTAALQAGLGAALGGGVPSGGAANVG